MKDKNMYSRNGFSLVELIIAIAILAIFVGVTSLSVGLLRSADTKGLASEINNSLTDLKAMTESHKGPYYLHIYKTDSGYYAHYDEDNSFSTIPTAPLDGDTRLGMSNLTVYVVYKSTDISSVDDPSTVDGVKVIDSSYSPTIVMRKKDGAYEDITDGHDNIIESVPKYMEIRNGTKADYRVYMAKDTGLHYMEQL